MSKRTKAKARTLAKVPITGIDQAMIDTTPKGPIVYPQVVSQKSQDIIARPPVIDRYPIIIGANLTGQYVSAAFRLCNTGWRYQFVDLVNELLEADPDARGVVRARVLGVANGRHEILPADIPKDDPEIDLAKEIAQRYGEQFKAIPKLQQRTAQLLWGDIYGVSAAENIWDRNGPNWDIIGLSNIHSRRLNYPNPTSWDLYIYDQGLVGPGVDYMGPTTGVMGLRVSQFPGKFTIHTPALNGDYPTRDGEARYIVYNLLFKRMLMRATAQDFERVIKPWVIGYFNRRLAEGTTRSIANPEDEQMLQAVVTALASGSLLSGTLPDSTKVEVLKKEVEGMSAIDFLNFLVRGFAKSLLGQSFTTEPGPNGNLATAEQAAKDTQKIFRYSSRCLCDTFEEDVARIWMQLNYPDAAKRLMPRHNIQIDELPDPAQLTKMVGDASHNMPEYSRRVDLDDLAERTGVKLLSEDDARPLPTSPAQLHSPVPPKDGEPGSDPTPKNGASKEPKTPGAPIVAAAKTDTN
jgi:hypothetical protein